MSSDGPRIDEIHRRRSAALAGHHGDEATARPALEDPSPGVRATALGALARMGTLGGASLARALGDEDVGVRRRACEVSAAHTPSDPVLATDPDLDRLLVALLEDRDPSVVEAAAWALGERRVDDGSAIDALAAVVDEHVDGLCREAAVAALGAIGSRRGLPSVLRATRDRATVRRRAVLALAPFEGPEVDEALARALEDRDWQVRQAAEDLVAED